MESLSEYDPADASLSVSAMSNITRDGESPQTPPRQQSADFPELESPDLGASSDDEFYINLDSDTDSSPLPSPPSKRKRCTLTDNGIEFLFALDPNPALGKGQDSKELTIADSFTEKVFLLMMMLLLVFFFFNRFCLLFIPAIE